MKSAGTRRSPQKKDKPSRGLAIRQAGANDGATLPLKSRRSPFIAAVAQGLVECGVALIDRQKPAPASTGAPLVVGISGGADSVSLLLACVAMHRRNRQRLAGAPIAVHVHHHLRESADADAAFVQDLCDRFAIPLRIEHVHPGLESGNASANARKMRYAALARCAAEADARDVAVAHHADDQFETILMALCRGAGIEGLAGMPSVRPLDAGSGTQLRLIRPMLALGKAACEAFCRDAGIQWREDPTNTRRDTVRGRLRADVIPVLEELWPGVCGRQHALSSSLSHAARLLMGQVEQAFGDADVRSWSRTGLREIAQPLLAAGLRRAAIHWAPAIADRLDQEMLAAVARAIASADLSPRRFDWPGGLAVRVTSRQVSLARTPQRSDHRKGIDA